MKSKPSKKFLLPLALFLILCTLVLTACSSGSPISPKEIEQDGGIGGNGTGDDETGEDETGDDETGDDETTNPILAGTHVDNSKPTDKFIMENGATDYKIVIRAPAVGNGDYWMLERIAALELARFFEEATGVVLPIVKDDAVQYSDDATYISIGKNLVLDGSGIVVDYSQLKGGGFRIVTKGKSVFLTGGDAGTTGEEAGFVYAVYEFLYKVFDLDFFFTDSYSINKNVTNIPLMDYDINEVPDIEYRATNYSFVDNQYNRNWDWYNFNLYRYRQIRSNQLLLGVGEIGNIWHNSFEYVGAKTTPIPGWFGYVDATDPVMQAHPKWFSIDKTNSGLGPDWSHVDRRPNGLYDGTQLCYNAQGDEDERDALLQASFNTLKISLINSPKKNIVTYTIQDIDSFCDCDACHAVKEQYGANSASVILFCNDLNRIVKEWFKTEEGIPYARDLEIVFFAYQSTVDAPTKGNIKCDDGVSVFYAPINADFTRSLNDPANATTKNTIEAWAKVSDKIFLWTYSTNFSNYFTIYDTFDSMQDTYKLAFEHNAVYLFDQAQVNQANYVTSWETLKAYLTAKLAWNVNADVDALTDRFFAGYFGEAAPQMRQYFDDMRLHMNTLKNTTDYGGTTSIAQNTVTAKYFPKDVLMRWKGYAEGAIAALEPIRLSDPERYASLYDHIVNERLSVLYMLIEIYGSDMPAAEVLEHKLAFKEDVTRFNGYRDKDDVADTEYSMIIQKLLTKWGV
ncbi:MAG: DUF4838 domain-containing protein [Clostridiaceae bacterium]|jgi:hypothetical protein|nr:DUF4838 domain-containing protein [Clostridiaceae bacterium]